MFPLTVMWPHIFPLPSYLLIPPPSYLLIFPPPSYLLITPPPSFLLIIPLPPYFICPPLPPAKSLDLDGEEEDLRERLVQLTAHTEDLQYQLTASLEQLEGAEHRAAYAQVREVWPGEEGEWFVPVLQPSLGMTKSI